MPLQNAFINAVTSYLDTSKSEMCESLQMIMGPNIANEPHNSNGTLWDVT